MDIDKIKNKLKKFAEERDWEQFHSPKNLTMALSGEVGELSEIFQWLSDEESKKANISEIDLKRVREEIEFTYFYYTGAYMCIYAIYALSLMGYEKIEAIENISQVSFNNQDINDYESLISLFGVPLNLYYSQ